MFKKNITKFVFPKFKTVKIAIILFAVLSIMFSFGLYFYGNFSSDDLRDISELSLNVIFIIGALGISIFTLNIPSTKNNKSKFSKKHLITSYISLIFFNSSIAILAYIFSLYNFFPWFYKAYSILSLICLCYMLIATLTYIMEYFGIKD